MWCESFALKKSSLIKEVVVNKAQPWRFPLHDARDQVSRAVAKADPKRTGIDVAEGSLPEGSDASVPPPPSVTGGVMGTRVIIDEQNSGSAPLQAAGAPRQAAELAPQSAVGADSATGSSSSSMAPAAVPPVAEPAPVAGGDSAWQHVNQRHASAREKMEKHKALFRQMRRRVEAVASAAHEAGNKIAIEWPRSCAYWKLDCVKLLLRQCGLQAVKVDGCAFAMVDPGGAPVLKPWTIATNDAVLAQSLACRCPGRGHHARIAGKIAAGTASDPENMAKTIH